MSYSSQGQFYARMEDGYWQDFNLTASPPPGNNLSFVAVKTLDLDHFEVGRGISGDRFFVRAFAETIGDATTQRPARYAFSNPIWILRSGSSLAVPPRLPPPPPIGATRNAEGQVSITFTGMLQ